MDTTTLGAALALAKSIPGTAVSEAQAVLTQAEAVVASIPSDYSEMDDRVDALETELYEETKFTQYDLSSTNLFTVDTRTGYSVNVGNSGISSAPRSIILNANANYDSYCFIPSGDIVVYCDATDVAYYAIAWLTDPVNPNWGTSGSDLVKAGQTSTRDRKSDNNLPTKASPLTIPAGSQVVVTVTAGKTPTLYVQEATVGADVAELKSTVGDISSLSDYGSSVAEILGYILNQSNQQLPNVSPGSES